MSENKEVMEYLSTSSPETLEAFRISRLDRASLLRAQITELYESWVQAGVEASIAEWILERRRAADPLARFAIQGTANALSHSGSRLASEALPVNQLTGGVEQQIRGQLKLQLESRCPSEPQRAATDQETTDAVASEHSDPLASPLNPLECSPDSPSLLSFPDRRPSQSESLSPRGPVRAAHREDRVPLAKTCVRLKSARVVVPLESALIRLSIGSASR